MSLERTDSAEILTANPAFLTKMTKSIRQKCSQVIAISTDSRKWQNRRPKRLYCHFRLSVVVAIVLGQFFSTSAWSRTPDLSLEFRSYI